MQWFHRGPHQVGQSAGYPGPDGIHSDSVEIGWCDCQDGRECPVRLARQRVGRERREGCETGVRTNVACLVRRFGREFPGGHPVLPWFVKYFVKMLNTCRMSLDGETAYKLRKGRKFARAPPHFAKEILFIIPGSRRVWRESNQDGGRESSLVCLIGVMSSTWVQTEAYTRFGHSDVATLHNGLTTLSWMP